MYLITCAHISIAATQLHHWCDCSVGLDYAVVDELGHAAAGICTKQVTYGAAIQLNLHSKHATVPVLHWGIVASNAVDSAARIQLPRVRRRHDVQGHCQLLWWAQRQSMFAVGSCECRLPMVRPSISSKSAHALKPSIIKQPDESSAKIRTHTVSGLPDFREPTLTWAKCR